MTTTIHHIGAFEESNMATTAIKAGRLIDGIGAEVRRNEVILIEGKTIERIGGETEVTIPAGTLTVDASSYTVMPGMMDIHLHLSAFNNRTFRNCRVAQWEVTPQLQELYTLFHAQLCFEMGFTTLRDLGGITSRGLFTEELVAVRNIINAGCIAGPRLLVAGFTIMTCSHLDLILPKAALRPHPMMTGDGPWELRKLARLNVRQGCDVIKACASGGGGTDNEDPDVRNMTQEELDAIVDEAHALGKPCAVHCFTPESQRMALKAGADTIEHMVFHDDETLERIRQAGVWMVPTLSHRTDHAIEIRRQTGTAKFVLDKMKKLQPYCFETFQKCHRLGINIACGTDMQLEPGMGSNAQELEIYCDLGMTPMEAILTATRNAAIAIGRGHDLGTLKAGNLADIVIVDGDPLADIKVLQERERIVTVMKEGEVYIDRREGTHRKEVVHAKPDSWRKIDA
jgi:imidazolonepropionase-like amidohydrolase